MFPHSELLARMLATSFAGSDRHRLQRQSLEQSDSQASLSRACVLWIDARVEIGNPGLRLLTLQGFDIEYARTGWEGLRKARKKRHAGIILDLRLPDMPGLDVLQLLTTGEIETSILVVTGFADGERAAAAIKLGAVDYKSKPFVGDDLIRAARTLVSAVAPKVALEPDNPVYQCTRFVHALHEMAHRLTTPEMGVLEYVSLARSFRELVARSDSRNEVETMRFYCTPKDTAVATDSLEHVAQALSCGILPSLERVAEEISVPAEHVSHILKVVTNSGFRECRRSLRVRPTIYEVARSHEQIAQIAYRHGYEWAGQLDRDFKTTLLLTPSAFRRLFRTMTLDEPVDSGR